MIKALLQNGKIIGVVDCSVKETGFAMYNNGGAFCAAQVMPYSKLTKEQQETFNILKEQLCTRKQC